MKKDKKIISNRCNINYLNNKLGINDNPELKAFITIQTFSIKRFNGDYKSNIRGVSYDQSRGKWQARYKINFETDIVKRFYHRYNSKEEAENEMICFKKSMLKKLYKKYPKYIVRNSLERRVNSGKADDTEKRIYKIIKDWSNEKLINFLITTDNIFDYE